MLHHQDLIWMGIIPLAVPLEAVCVCNGCRCLDVRAAEELLDGDFNSEQSLSIG